MEKIDTLTGLRFIAALMIIIFHGNGSFYSSQPLGSFSLHQGVSVFFILSGFILTYVYPQLRKEDVLTFLKARIARIWPAHVAALVLCCLVLYEYVQLRGNFYYFLVSLTMIGTWIPHESFISKFNVPAWSIGTECFFYLCFPFLIYKLSKNWHIKLTLTLSLAIAIIMICNMTHLPLKGSSIDVMCWVDINPLSRLFEFTLGMCTALLYSKCYRRIYFTFLTATIVELISLALLIFSLKNNIVLFHYLLGHFFGSANEGIPTAGELWVNWSGGSAFFIALFIFVLAFQKGIISSLLRLPILLALGEMSYSLYLVHYCFLNYYVAHAIFFKNYMNSLEIYSLYWVIILSCAYFIWRFIEIPSRQVLRNISFSSLSDYVTQVIRQRIPTE